MSFKNVGCLQNPEEFFCEKKEKEKQQFYLDRLAFKKTQLSAPVPLGNTLTDYVNLDGEFLDLDQDLPDAGPLESSELVEL